MRENTNIEKDFRKWILFNNLLSDFQNLYELYTSVDSKSNKGGVSFYEKLDGNDPIFSIEQNGNDSTLELIGDANRKRFLEYLVLHYFPNQEIEYWYQAKVSAKEKLENHTLSENSESSNILSSINRPNIHPKESKYYNIRVFFSAIFYLFVIGLVVNSFLTSIVSGIITILSITGIVFFFMVTRRFSQGFFIGLIKGSSVKINEHQYPEIFKIVKEQANEMKLEEIPDVYISYGHFNAFVTKLARRKYLVLYSEVIEMASKGDFEVIKFVVGHELGHLKRRHLSKDTWLTPSLLIPFLKQAHSRGCEYTCDRIGYHFSKQGSIEGIIILSTGKEIYTKIDAKQYIKDSESDDSFWVWFSEKFLSHPHTFKRLSAIKKYDKNGY